MNPRTRIPAEADIRGRAAARRHGLRRLGLFAVVALAVLIALPASATSAALVTGKQIKDGSVTGRDLRDDSITTREFGHLPPGPPGPEGDQGAPGPSGPQGPPGTSGWVTVTSNGVAVVDVRTVQVDCPAGVAVAGGVGASHPEFARVAESAPSDLNGTGWVATVRNATPGLPLTIFAWAICVTP